jgi:hypothetical protein
MNIDAHKQVIKSVNELDIMELQCARKIAAERLRNRLYLDIEDNVSDFSIKTVATQGFAAYHETRSTVGVAGGNQFMRSTRPIANTSARGMEFSFTPSSTNIDMQDDDTDDTLDSFQVDNLTVPAFIFLSTKFLLKHGLGLDGLFQQSGSELKTTALKTKITGKCNANNDLENGIGAVVEILSEKDSIELGVLLVEFLNSNKQVIPSHLHQLFKGILAINNSSNDPKRRLPSSTVLNPNEDSLRLLRDVLVLLPVDLRHILQWIISFLFQMSKTAPSRSFNAAARQLAQVFGPSLTRTAAHDAQQTPRRSNSDWSISLVELLIHSHELESGTSPIWSVSLAFQEEIKDKVRAASTPKRGIFRYFNRRYVFYTEEEQDKYTAWVWNEK